MVPTISLSQSFESIPIRWRSTSTQAPIRKRALRHQFEFNVHEPVKDVKNGNAKVFKQPGLLDKSSIRNRPFLLELNITKRSFEYHKIIHEPIRKRAKNIYLKPHLSQAQLMLFLMILLFQTSSQLILISICYQV